MQECLYYIVGENDEGEQRERDFNKAVECATSAFNMGKIKEASGVLGIIYLRGGFGIERNIELAKGYLESPLLSGDKGLQKALKVCKKLVNKPPAAQNKAVEKLIKKGDLPF